MTSFDLFGAFDPARILGFGKNYVDQNKQSNVKIIRTYDAYQDVVKFVYPELRANTSECREALDAALQALGTDKLAVYRGQIEVNTDNQFLEISMSRWNFEQIFATSLTLRLHNPGNIVAKYAPLVLGKDALIACITPSTNTVTLIYDNIYAPESKSYAIQTLLQNLPKKAKESVEFNEENQSLTMSFPVQVYESLTAHKVPLIRQVEKDQF